MVASKYAHLRHLSICDRLNQIDQLDWSSEGLKEKFPDGQKFFPTVENFFPRSKIFPTVKNFEPLISLSSIQTLTHFSIHEHFRNKSQMEKYVDFIREILESLSDGISDGMKLSHVAVPLAKETFSSSEFSDFLKKLQNHCRSLRLVGVFRTSKRSNDGANKVEPLLPHECENLNLIGSLKNLESLEMIEIPSLDNSFISNFIGLKNLKSLKLSWIGLFGGFKWGKELNYFLANCPISLAGFKI